MQQSHFDCVRMVALAHAAQRFTLEVAKPLAAQLPRGRRLYGQYRTDAHGVLTVVAEPVVGRPGPA